jgi:GSH-dependent disulfide-bond oxidoreductase
MIDIYNWPTSNGRKINIAVEELGIEYRIHPINIGKGDQFSPEFTKLNPNQKIPAIVDSDGPDGKPFTLFESGAILIYLADKCGKLLPASGAPRYETIQWLMFQMGGVGRARRTAAG